MSTIIRISNQGEEDGRTFDSIKYGKDCYNFQNLRDGSIIGECRYCELSTQCIQVDVLSNGEVIGMEAHYLPIYDAKGDLVSQELFCTGMHDHRPLKERLEDDRVS